MVTHRDIALRPPLAAALGGIIGVNRGRLEWTTGLRRTCWPAWARHWRSSCPKGFNDVLANPHVVLDPSPLTAQVIRCLTTSARLWAVASIGLAAGDGLYAAAAIMATALLWIILALPEPTSAAISTATRR